MTGSGPGAGSDKGPVRGLLVGASLAEGSPNPRLATVARAALERSGASVDRAAMADFDGPSYNRDVETHDGFPPGSRELHRRLMGGDAFAIASPEYNAS